MTYMTSKLSPGVKAALAIITIIVVLVLAVTIFTCVYMVRELNSPAGPNEVIRDEYFRCFGLPCVDFESAENKMKEIESVLQIRTDTGSETSGDLPTGVVADIRYTAAQLDVAKEMLQEEMGNGNTGEIHREKRLIRRYDYSQKWKLPIKYYFDGTHDGEQVSSIRKALSSWENVTCIRFKEVTSKPNVSGEHLIYFTKKYQTCWTYVGKVVPLQIINIGDLCFTIEQVGIAMHEIGHMLGLYHEQQREDRADNVRIHNENIRSYHSQFLRMRTINYGLAYDYTSIMHYKWNAAGTNYKKTVEALREPAEWFTYSMGQRVELSYIDVKRINLEYCRNECPHLLREPCKNGGYQDPTVCSSCRCPDGFLGTRCDAIKQSTHESCNGGTLEIQSKGSNVITSPGFTGKGHYNDFTECYWRIIAPQGENVKLEFHGEYAVYMHNLEVCYHWLEVKYEYDMEKPGPRFCGYRRPELALTSRTRQMILIFKSNYKTEWTNVRLGFNITVSAVTSDWAGNSADADDISKQGSKQSKS